MKCEVWEWLKELEFSFCFWWWQQRTFLDPMTAAAQAVRFGCSQSLAWALHLADWQKVCPFSRFGILCVFIQTSNAFSSLTKRSVCLPDVQPFLQSTGGKRAGHTEVVKIFMHFSDFGSHFLKLFSLRQTHSMKDLNPNGSSLAKLWASENRVL